MKGEAIDDRRQFGVELLRPSDDLAIVAVEGEVDIFTSPSFKKAVFRAIAEGATRVVVDLAEVTFIDSTALSVVISGFKGAAARGGTLDVVCRNDNIRRIFEIAGLDQILRVYRSRDEALVAKE